VIGLREIHGNENARRGRSCAAREYEDGE